MKDTKTRGKIAKETRLQLAKRFKDQTEKWGKGEKKVRDKASEREKKPRNKAFKIVTS